jgi:hypothetical protein
MSERSRIANREPPQCERDGRLGIEWWRGWAGAATAVAAGALIVVPTALIVVPTAHAAPGDLTLVSVATDGTQGDETSSGSSVSADGRHVAFAAHRAPGGNDVDWDVFVRDRLAGTTTVLSNGTSDDAFADDPSTSADGRYVAFNSSWNLVPEDTNGVDDVFVRDRGPQGTPPSSVTLTATADTYVNEQAKATIFGADSRLAARGVPRKQYLSYLGFALPTAPTGTTVTGAIGAILRIVTAPESFAGSTTTQPVRLVTGAWSEAATTFTTRPALGSQVGLLCGANRSATAYTVTLDAAALRALLGGKLNLAVTGSTVDDPLWFRSREAGTPSYRPQLISTFTS